MEKTEDVVVCNESTSLLLNLENNQNIKKQELWFKRKILSEKIIPPTSIYSNYGYYKLFYNIIKDTNVITSVYIHISSSDHNASSFKFFNHEWKTICEMYHHESRINPDIDLIVQYKIILAELINIGEKVIMGY